MNSKRFMVLCVGLVLAGCVDDGEPVRDVELVDAGTLCVFDEARASVSQPQSFEAGDRLVVSVQAPECLSHTCDVNRVAECSVTRVGDVLEVTSYLGYDEADADCTMDCTRLTATCESEPLEQGRYLIVLGDEAHRFSVPSRVNDPCL